MDAVARIKSAPSSKEEKRRYLTIPWCHGTRTWSFCDTDDQSAREGGERAGNGKAMHAGSDSRHLHKINQLARSFVLINETHREDIGTARRSSRHRYKCDRSAVFGVWNLYCQSFLSRSAHFTGDTRHKSTAITKTVAL